MKQKSVAHLKEYNKLMENAPEETQMSDLLDKDIKTTLLKMPRS